MCVSLYVGVCLCASFEPKAEISEMRVHVHGRVLARTLRHTSTQTCMIGKQIIDDVRLSSPEILWNFRLESIYARVPHTKTRTYEVQVSDKYVNARAWARTPAQITSTRAQRLGHRLVHVNLQSQV